VVLSGAVIAGDVEEDDLGLSLTGGTLAGAVSLDELFTGLNTYLMSDSCSCLGLREPLIDLDTRICRSVDSSTCADMGQDICATISGACGLLVPIVAGQAELDTDNDGELDSLSIYLYVEMDGTNISGPSE
jgi:hypothetical protein